MEPDEKRERLRRNFIEIKEIRGGGEVFDLNKQGDIKCAL